MNIVQLICLIGLLIFPFILMKYLIKKIVKQLGNIKIYLMTTYAIVLIVVIMILFAVLGMDQNIKFMLITYLVYLITVTLGLLFQEKYFKYSKDFDLKVEQYLKEKRG